MPLTCAMKDCPLDATHRVDNGAEAACVCEGHALKAVKHPKAPVGPEDVTPLPEAA